MSTVREGMPDVMKRPESDAEMSNFDHSIDEGMEEDLRAGMRSCHSAWDFNGIVWYDAERELFCEAVQQFHELRGVVTAGSLRELMTGVNDIYGSA